MARGSNTIGHDGNIVIGTSVDMYGMNTGLNKIQKSIKKLQMILAGSVFMKFGKAALQAASDLQEVQNVVDVSFGDMSYKIENFSKVAIEKFGMSEFAAKQTAGSFMAMGKSMGLSMENASNMAVQLTALTADFASFYNISQDYARVALSAVYTGETETLKRYGIILTEANLQEFASTKGITTKVKAMNAHDKAMLRYMYIMESTNDMQGDFVRTQNSWANQLKLLKEQWTVFMNVLGSGLITVLTPVLQWVNAMIQALTRLSKVIGQALITIFGLVGQDFSQQMSAASETTEDAAGSMEDLTDETKAAGKAAKKSLAAFDDLNVLTQPKSSGSGTDEGASTLDFEIPELDLGPLDEVEEKLDEISSMFDLGAYISTSIVNALNDINWDEIKGKATSFSGKMAEFINGLVSVPGLGIELGSSLGNAIDTAIKSINTFYDNVEWQGIGGQIANFITSAIDNIDPKTFGEASVGLWNGLFDSMGGFAKNYDPKRIYEPIATAINTAISSFKWAENASNLSAFVIDLLETITGLIKSLDWAGFGTGVGTAINNIDWSGALTTAASGLDSLVSGILTSITTLCNTVDWAKLGKAIIDGISAIDWEGLLGDLGSALNALVGGILDLIIGLLDNIDWASAGDSVVNGIVNLINNIDWEGLITKIGTGLEKLVNGVVTFVSELIGGLVALIWQALCDAFEKDEDNKESEAGGNLIAGIFKGITDALAAVGKWITDNIFTPFMNGFKNAFGIHSPSKEMDTMGGFIIEGLLAGITAMMQKITEVIGKIKEAILAPFRTVKRLTINIFNSLKNAVIKIWEVLTDKVKKPINAILGIVEGFVNGIIEGINIAIRALNTFKVEIPEGVPVIGGQTWGINIPELSKVTIPKLAKGAVIPPNKEFMAILGDQKHGTNIEAPLDTIVDAFKQVLNESPNNTQRPIVIEITGDMGKFLRAQEKAEYSKNIRLGMI